MQADGVEHVEQRALLNHQILDDIEAIELYLARSDRSAIGWRSGRGLSAATKADVDDFIAALGAGDVQLYVGPLDWQDGSSFLADGEHASDVQIWYAEQLLNGIVGTSTAAP